MGVVSPCVGICKLDERTGYCVGCARTGDEIADWREKTEAWRAAVWQVLPDRFDALGVACRRLPWTTDDIRTFVLRSLEEGQGTWAVGVVGAVGDFAAAPGQAIDVRTDGESIIATTAGGRLNFRIDDHVRALTFGPTDTQAGPDRIVLAVKRSRWRHNAADRLTPLGKDLDAILSEDNDASLFDLGLGRKEVRFCVRVRPGEAHDVLSRASGSAFPANLAQIGASLLNESPARVIETALGRIEVLTPIPMPGGKSPPGPHTHLLPDHLATGRAMPVGMDLPSAYVPGAIYYPPR